MSLTSERKVHLNLNESFDTQLEMNDGQAPITQDFDGKLADAQRQLEYLQSKRTQLEQQKIELEQINQRKQEFLHGQLDITERLSTSVTAIEREVFDMRQEIEEMEQTKQSFASHLQKIESLNPEAWPREQLGAELDRSISLIDQADAEYEQAISYLSGHKHNGLFGLRGRQSPRRTAPATDFLTHLRNGFAFNLPIILLGIIALILFLQ